MEDQNMDDHDSSMLGQEPEENLAIGTWADDEMLLPQRAFLPKVRSLSAGEGQLSASVIVQEETTRGTSKDDSSLPRPSSLMPASSSARIPFSPVTLRRPDLCTRSGLSLQMPAAEVNILPPSQVSKPTPQAAAVEPTQLYTSPTNILPRRSRGLDFSRAATSLHHSTLAEQSSPESSPSVAGKAMSFPAGRDYGTAELTTNSLWSVLGAQERVSTCSSVVGHNNAMAGSDSSSSSDEDYMDTEMEDAIMGSPQVAMSNTAIGNSLISSAIASGNAARVATGNLTPPVHGHWLASLSPAANSFSNFRIKRRKQHKNKVRAQHATGYRVASPASLSKSPSISSSNQEPKDVSSADARRESITWAANQLNISSNEKEANGMEAGEAQTATRDGQLSGVIRRPVTRRGNLLPKTKGFARIRAALLEESAPVDCETRREAEVVRQVRESDMNLDPRLAPEYPPRLDIAAAQEPVTMSESVDGISEDKMMIDSAPSSTFNQQAVMNSKDNHFWDRFSDGSRTTPPPRSVVGRGSSSGLSEDVAMDSPSNPAASWSHASVFGAGLGTAGNAVDSARGDMGQVASSTSYSQGGSNASQPTAAEMTRKINQKRRRDDDLDLVMMKRRAVSPMSVHGSPIMQSPLQRESAPWGSRPGSTHGSDKAVGGENGSNGRPGNGFKGRIGFQGMVDTNDGLMRMSIE